MSELVYVRTMRGGVTVQKWIGPPYVGVSEYQPKGFLAHTIIERIPIALADEGLTLDQLMVKYPLTQWGKV